jgi:hypothetical protein
MAWILLKPPKYLIYSKRLFIGNMVTNTRVYPKVSGLAVWSENCKWYGSLPLDTVSWFFCESV